MPKQASKKKTRTKKEQQQAVRDKMNEIATRDARKKAKRDQDVSNNGESSTTDEQPTKPNTSNKPKQRTKGARTSAREWCEAELKKSGSPMHVTELLDAIQRAGWQTNSKTPEWTIYAMIVRDIKSKGENSRFRKIDGGTFALAD